MRCKSVYALATLRSSKGAKIGGGDGSRTHVRIISNFERYMLSLSIYELISFKDTAQLTRHFSVQTMPQKCEILHGGSI